MAGAGGGGFELSGGEDAQSAGVASGRDVARLSVARWRKFAVDEDAERVRVEMFVVLRWLESYRFPELRLQELTERAARARDARHDGTDGDVENERNVFVLDLFHVAE